MNVAVAGMGYVGLSIAVMLSRHHHVSVVDVVPDKVRMLEEGVSPIHDELIEEWLSDEGASLDLHPTLDASEAYCDADIVVIAVPTNYDPDLGGLDTSCVDEVVCQVLMANPDAVVVIKSTVPVGYTDRVCLRHPQARILFSPEFLREGHALEDCLYPSRVIVGTPRAGEGDKTSARDADAFASLMVGCSEDSQTPMLVMSAHDAEAVKLFSNTYLAMRVAFFNELDTFANEHGFDAPSVIAGMGLDPRIGAHYNNPSFGYGGYCLPKDSRELLSLAQGVPQELFSAIVASNATRQAYIANDIARTVSGMSGLGKDAVVGIFRLAMKKGSDNYRGSATLGVMERLSALGVEMVLFEPSLPEGGLQGGSLCGATVVRDLGEFKRASTIIVANRKEPELADVSHKLYTRDIYGRD